MSSHANVTQQTSNFHNSSDFFMYHVHSCATSGPPGYVSMSHLRSSSLRSSTPEVQRHLDSAGRTVPDGARNARNARPCVPARKRRTSIESCTFEYLFYQNYSIHLILRILLLLRTFEVQVFQGWSLRTRPLVHKNRQKPRPSWVLGDMD